MLHRTQGQNLKFTLIQAARQKLGAWHLEGSEERLSALPKNDVCLGKLSVT